MFGLGIWEIVVILAVALIVLGPTKLPDVARQIGRLMREFRRATNELRYNLDEAVAPREPPARDPARAEMAPPTESVRTPAPSRPGLTSEAAGRSSPSPPAGAASSSLAVEKPASPSADSAAPLGPGKPDGPAG
jgi:Tat protein translocase TatB subunit